ncbi:hypothetical protein CEV31_4036 [Brucella thiophenivorans]|uniref:Uncharacterized protein n=1 Tax=Brucella thiophenivorans TaxID=571255 RepID=A0A256F0P5_9HYPH|nr:hypothetical protein CEV31_4036 [Brucella thiophenivorans]
MTVISAQFDRMNGMRCRKLFYQLPRCVFAAIVYEDETERIHMDLGVLRKPF